MTRTDFMILGFILQRGMENGSINEKGVNHIISGLKARFPKFNESKFLAEMKANAS